MSARRSACCEKKCAEKYVEITADMAASKSMELSRQLDKMDAAELRSLTATLLAELASRDQELKVKQLKIDQLTHEMAILKRYRFDRRSEQMDPAQRSLLRYLDDAELSMDNNRTKTGSAATGLSPDLFAPVSAPLPS
jgi:transposase